MGVVGDAGDVCARSGFCGEVTTSSRSRNTSPASWAGKSDGSPSSDAILQMEAVPSGL